MAAITVGNFTELRNAITDSTSTEIYLSQDIAFTSTGGAIIPRTKGDIIIDGNGFTITDYASSSIADTIRIESSGTPMKVTVRNIVWSGRNHYGIVQMQNAASTNNVTLVLDNVNYVGPQAVYHRQGITHVINSIFNIEKNGIAGSSEEFGEINRIIFSGNVTINSASLAVGATYSVMWLLNSGASFNVEENATLTINAPSTYLFYIDTTEALPDMVFSANSVTNISVQNGLFYNASTTLHMASNFTLGSNASLTAIQTGRNGAVPSFKCRNSFTLQGGSSFLLAMPFAGTSALMYFPIRTILNFNNPKNAVLYNNGGRMFSFGAGTAALPNTINIEAELLNMWTAAKTPFETAGRFDDIPSRAIAKENGSNISASIYTTTSTTSSISSNIMDGDKGFPLTNTSFNVMSAQVISMGNINIELDEISDASISITGTTEPSANLRASYDSIALTGAADISGAIDLPVTPFIPADTDISFSVNWKFLIKEILQKVGGSVRITYLPNLIFKTFPVPCRRGLVKRVDPDWYLEVTDTRTTQSSDWYLYASIPAPLSSTTSALEDNALIYNGGTYVDMLPNIPVLIKQESWSEPVPKVTKITWSELEGFLLKVNPIFLYSPGKYTTRLNWDIKFEQL